MGRRKTPVEPFEGVAPSSIERPYFASEMIRILQDQIEQHGDMPVYFVSNQDWGIGLQSYEFIDPVADPDAGGWDYTPEDHAYLYFGV